MTPFCRQAACGALARGFVLAALLALAACDRGPAPSALTVDLNAAVESDFAPGLLTLEHVVPAEDTTLAGFDRNRRVIRYSADLRVNRDHDFGAWDQANAIGLIHILGARAEDIRGIKPNGNQAGDTLQARGAIVYVRENRQWRLAGAAPTETHPPALESGRLAVLREYWRLGLASVRATIFTSQSSTVVSELIAAAARIGRLEGGLAVASGPTGSDAWSVAEAAHRQRLGSAAPLINLTTEDTFENLRLLRDGMVTAAIVRNDEAAMAVAGSGAFERAGTFSELRSLGSLFPQSIHVIVMAASNIASVGDLYNRRIAVAATGPGAATEADDVLRAHRVLSSSLPGAPDELAPDAALLALERGQIDAVILTAAPPSASLRQFAAGHSLRLVPLDGDAIALLTAGTSSYVAITLPARTYPQQVRPVSTIAVTLQLVSVTSVSNGEIDALLKLVFGEVDYLRHGSAAGAMIGSRSAHNGITIPMHPAAESFFIPASPPR